jgi:hypothetical protein
MDEDIIARADAYSAGRNLRVVGRLGFGIHGTVFAVEDNVNHGENGSPLRLRLRSQTAMKIGAAKLTANCSLRYECYERRAEK